MSDTEHKHHHASISQEDKIVAACSYFIFFLPLLFQNPSRFALFHANQGLILLICYFVVNIIGTFIPIIGWLLILPFGNLSATILLLLGIYHALKGRYEPLPLVGQYQLLGK